MELEQVRDYCLEKKGVTEELPFDEDTLVFKVVGKMFLLTNISNFETLNLKCEPDKAIDLRERYEEIEPGYHMNKKHWNTVRLHGRLSDKMILEMIDHSYTLVVSGLTKAQKELLGE